MLKAREILRLKHEVGLSLREIGQSCNCGKTTVSEVLERADKAGIHWPIDQVSGSFRIRCPDTPEYAAGSLTRRYFHPSQN